MRRRTIISLALGGSLAVVALALAWAFLAPGAIGGSTEYVMIDGSSMEPGLSEGDLALLRRRESYEVGDAVGYRSEKLGHLVLHRIIARDGDRFIFKGDANDFADVDEPTALALVGELWVSAPYAGFALAWLHEPTHAAIVAGIATCLLLLGGVGVSARRRRTGMPERVAPAGAAAGGWTPVRVGAAAFGAVLGLSALLALVAFTRPLERQVAVANAYAEHGAFSYSAPVKPDAVYPDGAVTTEEPIFLREVEHLPMSFSYELDSEHSASISGTASLVAVLGDGSGWTRTIQLALPRPFNGDRATVAGVLDLRSLRKMVAEFERQTGTTGSSYLVTLAAHVEIHGEVGGSPVSSSFAPEVPFRLDDYRLAPDTSSGTTVSFQHDRDGAIEAIEPNVISLRGASLSVASARRVASAAGIAALLLLLATWALVARRRGRDEPSRIAARYGSRLVVVSGPIEGGVGRVVDVGSVESLMRLAEHRDGLVLYERSGKGHTYLYRDGEAAYRYRVEEGALSSVRLSRPESLASEPPRVEGLR